MKILIVSYFFEPYNGVGAIRMTSFSKYLVENGNKVTIIKADNIYYGNNIHTTLENSKLKIINVKIKLKNDFLNFLRIKLTFKKTIDKELNKLSYDWIIFSGGPYFYFSLGRYFKKKYAINYILDFRDLWVYESRTPKKFLSKLYINIIRKYHSIDEKLSIKHAKYVITVTPSDNNRMINAYETYKIKFNVIYNGFDDNKLIDLSHISQKSNINNPINLMVFGKFMYYGEETSLIFFSTINNLIKNGKSIKITHIGNREEAVYKMLIKFDLPFDMYVCTGVCDYKKGMEVLQSADIFISIYPVRSGLGTKVFDYIFHNKPVVLFGYKNSEIATFFSQFENFYCCESTSEGSLIMTKIINQGSQKLDSKIDPVLYSRTYQWNKFIALLKS